jgi:glucose-1-phosphate cytidylyltransferase
MKVVLFCGGLGTRLSELAGDIPKPLVKIGYRPILWHVMKYYAHFGHKDFILCLGYKADKIKEYFLNYNEYLSNNFTMFDGGKDLQLEKSDITDWKIKFVDTGLKSNLGQRLTAVKKYLADEEIFLANYSDGLTNIQLPKLIDFFIKSGKISCFLSVRPSQSFSVVKLEDDGNVKSIQYVRDTNVLINGGFFIFRKKIFDYIEPGEELIEKPFQRLIQDRQLISYKCDQFWACMDTFKEHQELSDMYNFGNAPWEIWKT